MNTTWRGQWAVVTGASAGIGAEFARQLAAAGTNLILTARRVDRLSALAETLRKTFSIRVETIVADLENPEAPAAIYAFADSLGVTVSLLINNAGFGTFGEFQKIDADREIAMIQVNCAAMVRLTRLFLPGMVARRKGDVMILASTASFQPIPFLATYAATKVFDRFFAEAIAEEVKPFGVRVCALCPGATQSEFFDVSTMPAMRNPEPASVVVSRGLKALSKGRSSVISGLGNRLGTEIQRFVPRRLVTSMAAKMFKKRA